MWHADDGGMHGVAVPDRPSVDEHMNRRGEMDLIFGQPLTMLPNVCYADHRRGPSIVFSRLVISK